MRAGDDDLAAVSFVSLTTQESGTLKILYFIIFPFMGDRNFYKWGCSLRRGGLSNDPASVIFNRFLARARRKKYPTPGLSRARPLATSLPPRDAHLVIRSEGDVSRPIARCKLLNRADGIFVINLRSRGGDGNRGQVDVS